MDFDAGDEEAATMAAAMGFSSFGSHKASVKKRKFNPSTDAYVEGQELANLNRGGKRGTGSGGNTVPLGQRRIVGSHQQKRQEMVKEYGYENEIGPDEGGDEKSQRENTNCTLAPGAPRYLEKCNQNEINLDSDDGEEEPQYEDTSRTPPAETFELELKSKAGAEEAEMQARIDALLASIETGVETLPLHPMSIATPAQRFNIQQVGDIRCTQGEVGHGPWYGPPKISRSMGREKDETGGMMNGSMARDVGTGVYGGPRQSDKRWYDDYYDPSFNQNPWKKLEQLKGLKSLGSWI